MSLILWTYVPIEIENEVARFFRVLEEKHGHIIYCYPRNRQSSLKKWDVFNYFERIQDTQSDSYLTPNLLGMWENRYYLEFGKKKGSILLYERIQFARLLLNYLIPDILVSWNPTCLVYGPITDIAKEKNIEILYSERGLVPPGIILDPYGIYNKCKLNSITRDLLDNETTEKTVRLGEKLLNKLSKELPTLIKSQNKRDNNLVNSSKFSANRKTILVFGISDLQGGMYPEDLSDRKAVFPYWNNYSDMIKDLLHIDDIQVIFKPHPKYSIPVLLEEESDRLIISNDDPNNLIRKSDIVIANGTKLELNALLLNKPLILPGYGQFWNKGCAYEANSKSHLLKLVKSIELKLLPKQKNYLIKYLGRLTNQELFFFRTYQGEFVDTDVLITRFSTLCSTHKMSKNTEHALLLKYLRSQAIGDLDVPFLKKDNNKKWQTLRKIKRYLVR